MTRATGVYDIVSQPYQGVLIEAPVEFWREFDEKKLKDAGFG